MTFATELIAHQRAAVEKLMPLMGEAEAVALAEASSKAGDDHLHCHATHTLHAIAPDRVEEIKRRYPRPDPIASHKKKMAQQ